MGRRQLHDERTPLLLGASLRLLTAAAPPATPSLRSGNRRRVPSHGGAAATLRALLAACRLVEELGPAVHRACAQLIAQLAHSFFMPLCLTALAALARIQARQSAGAAAWAGALRLLAQKAGPAAATPAAPPVAVR